MDLRQFFTQMKLCSDAGGIKHLQGYISGLLDAISEFFEI